MNDGDNVRKSIRLAWPDLFTLHKEWLGADGLPDRACVAVVTYFPLCKYRYMPAFFKQLSAIESQLATTPGLLRCGLRASLLRKRFWTYSLWEDRAAVEEFLYEVSHLRAMLQFRQWGGRAKLRAFWTDHAELSWSEALRRLDGSLPNMTGADYSDHRGCEWSVESSYEIEGTERRPVQVDVPERYR